MTDRTADRDGSARELPNRSVPLASDAASAIPCDGASSGANPGSAGRGRWLAIAVLALAGAGLVLLSTARYGAGITEDSVWYIQVARSLVFGKGFVNFNGDPYVLWPPLYPMLLALIGFATRLDPTAFAHLANAVLFVLVIFLAARLLRAGPRHSVAYSLLGMCAVLFSRPLSIVYGWALSDCLFIPLVLLYLVSLQRYWDSGSMRSLALMAVSAGLALLTRYLGMALIPAGVLTIILASGASFGMRIRRACAFAGLSLVPIGLWLVYNPWVAGAWLGYGVSPTARDPRGFLLLLAANFKSCVGTILAWYVPEKAVWLIVPVGAAVAAAVLASSRTTRARVAGDVKSTLKHGLPGVILFATYILVTVFLVAKQHLGWVEDRYLAPLYVPVTLVLLELVACLFGTPRVPATAFVRKAPTILLALWLCFPLATVARSTADRFRNGAGGFNTKEWRESEAVAYAKQMLSHRTGVRVYTNVKYLLLWTMPGVDVHPVPYKIELTSSEGLVGRPGGPRWRWPAEGEAYLVWFSNCRRTDQASVEKLSEVADVEEVAQLDDGSIYRVSRRQAAVRDASPTGLAPPGQP